MQEWKSNECRVKLFWPAQLREMRPLIAVILNRCRTVTRLLQKVCSTESKNLGEL